MNLGTFLPDHNHGNDSYIPVVCGGMLALKKKREAEAAAKKLEEPVVAANTEGKVSLLGIGGQKKTKSGMESTGKKRTPGEIRIQKGTSLYNTHSIYL